MQRPRRIWLGTARSRLIKALLVASLGVWVAGLVPAPAQAEFYDLKPYKRPDLAVGLPPASAQVQGALVTLVPARAGDPAQQWLRINTYNGHKLVNRASGKCLDVANRSPNNNAPVMQWTCYYTLSQLWGNNLPRSTVLSPPGQLTFLKAGHASDKCLDIEAANGTYALKPGVRLVIYGCGSALSSYKQHYVMRWVAP